MTKRLAVLICVGFLAGCPAKAPKEMVERYEGKTLYTCCNLRYQGDEITDANYTSGSLLALGTPVTIEEVHKDGITFTAGGTRLTLKHVYGTGQESFQQYFDKIFVHTDRNAQVAQLPPVVQKAIREGRVEKGMKRVEVILALGYPPTDENPSPTASEWTYYHSQGKSFKVVFDPKGYVTDVVGRPAPTSDKPVRVAPKKS